MRGEKGENTETKGLLELGGTRLFRQDRASHSSIKDLGDVGGIQDILFKAREQRPLEDLESIASRQPRHIGRLFSFAVNLVMTPRLAGAVVGLLVLLVNGGNQSQHTGNFAANTL